jgi:hypothetical protein
MSNIIDNAIESLFLKAIKKELSELEIEKMAKRVAPKVLAQFEKHFDKAVIDNDWTDDLFYDIVNSKEVFNKVKTAIIKQIAGA